VVDASGVHRFNPHEVEMLARDLTKPRAFRSLALPAVTSLDSDRDTQCARCSLFEDRVTRLEAELDGVRHDNAVELDVLRASYRNALDKAAEEQRALESALAELLEALEQ
jgi:hypothetical protein